MGANMQRQAVPLLEVESPIVGTGIEKRVARDSGMCLIAKEEGKVVSASSQRIKVRYKDSQKAETYEISKFLRSNQDTCVNQKPVLKPGKSFTPGEVLADGSSCKNGELSLGKNLLVAFMPWEGYNFEDAILISERLVKEDVYTSIHIEKLEIDARSTKLGPEEITREIPNISEEALRNLDEEGIIRVGSYVSAGDILVGKISPKGESEQPPEEKLLRAIFGEKARNVKDNSLRVPHGESGKIVGVSILDRKKGDELPPVSNKIIKIYLAQKRRIRVGDKMAGRHGNKGIVSRILPEEDMPHLPDGTPVDIVLNPLGVPSRMNVGQVYETMLGLAGWMLDEKYEILPFDEMYEKEASRKLVLNKIQEVKEKKKIDWIQDDGKVVLIDGRTGEAFDRACTVGKMYMLKLVHLVDDKMHARSTGPYSLVTQQPLGGKAQFGGQRLGEMECWALEAYGAAHNLREMLTVKSDSMEGRTLTYEAIVKGTILPPPGIPESFKVLICELQAIGLDLQVLGLDEQEKLREIDVKINEGTFLNNDEDNSYLIEKEKSEGDFNSTKNKKNTQEDFELNGAFSSPGSNFNLVRVKMSSPQRIRKESSGSVKKAETINYRTLAPEKEGLFCQRIFGPVKDWECGCGKYKRIRYRGIVCEVCGVEVTESRVRRYRMGHIELACPISHIWFLKGIPSYLSLLLDMTLKDLEQVIYFNAYIVIEAPESGKLKKKQLLSEDEYDELVSEGVKFKAEMGAEAVLELINGLSKAEYEFPEKQRSEQGKLISMSGLEETLSEIKQQVKETKSTSQKT